jgi:hypothetical protein
MAIDLEGIMIISSFFALRLAVPLVLMIGLCKVLPICIPYDTAAES